MKKNIILLLTPIWLSIFVWGQNEKGQADISKVPEAKSHYEPEYAFDTSVNKQVWMNQQSGLHVSFGSTDKTYFRTEVPEQKESTLWQTTGWRGEKLNTQIVIWSPDTLSQVKVIVSDLVSVKGTLLSRKNFKVDLVRYVLSNYPYGASNAVCGEPPTKGVYLMPDRFEEFERFDLPGLTVRPLWLALKIPEGTEPGIYTGDVNVSTINYNKNLKIKINVQNQLLPPPHEWKYRLDIWQNPWVVAWHNHLKPWSEEHKALLKKHLQLYADAGGKFITTYAVHSPWADNSYMIEGTMIEWIKLKNGNWKFDYTIFDTYVALCMKLGIDKAITIYTPVPWGNRFRYKEESTGNYIYESWEPGSKLYSMHWNIFLTDLKSHLLKKGWFEKTYIGINESEMSQTLAAIKVVKKHSKNWKITYAGNWHKELDSLLDDYSFLSGKEPSTEELKQRSARGATSTFYVCCNPPKPNNFVFSPPIEGRWISWYSSAYGYNGFLRWAYDAWPEDPVRDARFGTWPAGDCYMVYPAANSCIRYEKLREGISDYEKIRILRDLVSKSTDRSIKELWKTFEQHLQLLTTEHDYNENKLTADVSEGKDMIDELSSKLEQQAHLSK